MPIFAVKYTYAPEQAELRDAIRPAHRSWLTAAFERGQLLASGPYTAGDGALIMIRAADAAAAAEFMDDDPFADAGVIAGRQIDEWLSVFGPFEN